MQEENAIIKHLSSILVANIARNNWYQLKVTSIADLGYPKPVPPTPENETKLMMSVTIAPWTIHINNVGL